MTDPLQHSLPRVLSGMRPTGRLHLGNYVGALKNWVELQHTHDCYFMIADWHALTTDFDNTRYLAENTREVLLDWLGAGLDPQKCVMFVQSHVLQHAELHVLLSMITPLGELERVPTYKDQQQNLSTKNLFTYGFLGYPVLQAADILVYRANFVPVGEDQVAHVELTRSIANRFNAFFPKGGVSATFSGPYGGEPPSLHNKLLIEPQQLLTSTPKLLGTDGRKMSKSYGNSILLSDSKQELTKKIGNCVTDRPKLTDRGNPDRCPVGNLHQIFSSQLELEYITRGCTEATILCTDCKVRAISSVDEHLRPIREKRREMAQNPTKLQEIIYQGAQKAAKTAEETMTAVREAVGFLGVPRPELATHQKDFSSQVLWLSEDPNDLPLRVPNSITEVAGDEARWEIRSNVWLQRVKTYSLRKDKRRVFITRKGRKVGVYDAAKSSSGEWVFGLKDQPLNVLVLLAQDEEHILHDYILPPKFLQDHWKQFDRVGETVEIHVRQVSNVASILLSNPNSNVAIQDYEGDYTALQ